MSFFNKLNSKFEGLMKDDEPPQADGTRGYEQQQYGGYNGYQPQQQSSGYPQYQTPPPQAPQYGAPPSQYGASPSQYSTPQNQYPSPPPQQYGAYPPPAAAVVLPPTPGVPQGWMPLWDPAGSRWAYLDLPNNTVSWSVPIAPAYASGDRGIGGYGSPAPSGYGSPVPGYGAPGGYGTAAGEPVKDNSKKNMLMSAAAGVAVGAVGGALIANALDDDDNHGGGYSQAPPMGAPLPETDADGSSVSSSDREEVEEAREEYEEAYEETYGSD